MAVNNEDRVSSQRLLDTLKGLQASRHLGSEPEVVTETVEYPAVVSPAPGTYQTQEEFVSALSDPNENRMPFKVYNNPVSPSEIPVTINQPTGNFVELTKKVNMGYDAYVETSFDTFENYTGFMLYKFAGMWIAILVTNGEAPSDLSTFYQWEMPAYTETNTTKTKRTIKQDYLPNADWNVNDPDADGYVEGRTHWVEVDATDVEARKADSGTMYFLQSFGKPKGFAWNGGEWYPDFEAVKFDSYEGSGMAFYLLAEDENGNQITEYTEEAVLGAKHALLVFDSKTYYGGVTSIGTINGTPQEIQTVRIVSEIVHKLDRKFYDYTEPYDDTVCVKKNELQIKHSHIEMTFSDLSPKTVGYDYLDLPDCKIVGNIKSFVDSWDTQTNTGVMNAVNNPIANTTVGTTGICCLSNGLLQFVNEGTNGIVLKNPYPSTLNLSRGADLNIAQTFIIESTD